MPVGSKSLTSTRNRPHVCLAPGKKQEGRAITQPWPQTLALFQRCHTPLQLAEPFALKRVRALFTTLFPLLTPDRERQRAVRDRDPGWVPAHRHQVSTRSLRFAARPAGAVERCSWSRPGVGPSARSPGLDNRAQGALGSTNGVSTIAFMNNARNLKNPQRLGRSCAEDRRRMLRACAEFPILDPSFIRDEKHVLRPCRRQGPVQGRKHGLPGCGQRHQVGIRQLSVSPDPGEWDIDVGDRVRPEID